MVLQPALCITLYALHAALHFLVPSFYFLRALFFNMISPTNPMPIPNRQHNARMNSMKGQIKPICVFFLAAKAVKGKVVNVKTKSIKSRPYQVLPFIQGNNTRSKVINKTRNICTFIVCPVYVSLNAFDLFFS